MRKSSALLAIPFGLFLAVGEVVRNFGTWQWWPFWLVDFLAAGLLIAGGFLSLRRQSIGRPLLSGAWGFASAMFYMSFWSHVEQLAEPADGNIPQQPLTVIIGALLLVAVVGFVLSLLPEDSDAR